MKELEKRGLKDVGGLVNHLNVLKTLQSTRRKQVFQCFCFGHVAIVEINQTDYWQSVFSLFDLNPFKSLNSRPSLSPCQIRSTGLIYRLERDKHPTNVSWQKVRDEKGKKDIFQDVSPMQTAIGPTPARLSLGGQSPGGPGSRPANPATPPGDLDTPPATANETIARLHQALQKVRKELSCFFSFFFLPGV